MNSRRYRYWLFTGCLLIMLTVSAQQKRKQPQAYGPVPTAAQLRWHEQEYYWFLHFGPNTFTGKEWGEGSEKPSEFHPTQLDCEQWARLARQAGARGLIITAKHHDGFCLWPSATSQHTVRESSWKNGRGDVLRELSAACKKYGLWMGVYLSPWDRNHPQYGTDEYNDVYIRAMKELLTDYGDIFELWWDGANGEGPNGRKQVYDFARFEDSVFTWKPDLIVFSDIGPTIRWVGNEQGFAGETNWNTLDTAGFTRGHGAPSTHVLNTGNMGGAHWIPAEVDVSIRPGWFYRAGEDHKVKTREQLLDIYYKSVGRGANLLLNVPPDTRGLIHENDSAAVMLLRRAVDSIYMHPVEKQLKKVTANGKEYPKKALLDHELETHVNAGTDTLLVEYRFNKATDIRHVYLQEAVQYGQRVKQFVVEALQDGTWKVLHEGSTIGYRRLLPVSVTTMAIRLRITHSLASPVLAGFRLYQ